MGGEIPVRILLAAATPIETALIRRRLRLDDKSAVGGKVINHAIREVRLIHTGIGMVNTAIHLTSAIKDEKPDLLINLGIAGAFSKSIAIGSVVEVGEDAYPELGAESGQSKLSLVEMGFELMQTSFGPVYNRLRNPMSFPKLAAVQTVPGITVNRIHGEERSIREVLAAWNPHVETMETAAVFQTCLTFDVPFRCFRGISNHVERRNRGRWQIGRAAESVQRFVLEWIRGF